VLVSLLWHVYQEELPIFKKIIYKIGPISMEMGDLWSCISKEVDQISSKSTFLRKFGDDLPKNAYR
jgi:hypothetical protein